MQWVRVFVIVRGFRRPRDMGREEIEDYLVMLANESRVAVPTHNQELSALPYATSMRLRLHVRPL